MGGISVIICGKTVCLLVSSPVVRITLLRCNAVYIRYSNMLRGGLFRLVSALYRGIHLGMLRGSSGFCMVFSVETELMDGGIPGGVACVLSFRWVTRFSIDIIHLSRLETA